MPRIIAVFVVLWPIIEIALFVTIGGRIGLGWTFFIILLTGLIGVHLIRFYGLSALYQANLQNQPQRITQNMLGVFAGLLLLLPGFLTDALGVLLWWKKTQKLILDKTMHNGVKTRSHESDRDADTHSARKGQPKTIEGEYYAHDRKR